MYVNIWSFYSCFSHWFSSIFDFRRCCWIQWQWICSTILWIPSNCTSWITILLEARRRFTRNDQTRWTRWRCRHVVWTTSWSHAKAKSHQRACLKSIKNYHPTNRTQSTHTHKSHLINTEYQINTFIFTISKFRLKTIPNRYIRISNDRTHDTLLSIWKWMNVL